MFEPFVTKLGQTRFLIWVLEFGFFFGGLECDGKAMDGTEKK